MAATEPPRLVLPYASGGAAEMPTGDSAAAMVWSMLDRDRTLSDIAEHVGSPEAVVTHARDWATHRHPAPTGAGAPCERCGRRCEGRRVLVLRVAPNLEAGDRGQWVYELPPFPAFFPLCASCAARQGLFIRMAKHWHRPAVLLAMLWVGSLLAIALVTLFGYSDAYHRFQFCATYATVVTALAIMAFVLLLNLKYASLPSGAKRVLRIFDVHSIDVVDLADDREQGVRAVGDASNGR